MRKINRTQLIVSMFLLVTILMTLHSQYEGFMFHAYRNLTYDKQIFIGKTDGINVDYYSIINDENGINIGNAIVSFSESVDDVVIKSVVNGQEIDHNIKNIGNNQYSIDLKVIENINVVNGAYLMVNDKMIELTKINVKEYAGQNKEFNITGFFIYKNRMQLPQINCINLSKWKEKYSGVRIEYSYKLSGKDDYVVFYRESGTFEEIFNNSTLRIEDATIPSELQLTSLDLDIIIILEGEEELAFVIDVYQVSEVEQ